MAKGSTGPEEPAHDSEPATQRKPVRDRRIQPPPGSRQSVATARQTDARSNRTQLRLLAAAVVVVIAIVVVGLVLNKKQNASPVTNHPKSVSSTATMSGGVVTATGTGSPAVTIDLYEDGLCPACQDLQGQYGQQIMQAVDEGKLSVRYHFLNFLDPRSASKSYSTRSAAAFLCVAEVPAAEAPKGLFLNFHTMMFTKGTQPAEDGTADLSNADLARLALTAGAPQSAAACITSGAEIAQAKATAAQSAATLTRLAPGGVWAAPSAVEGGALLELNSTDWLTNILP